METGRIALSQQERDRLRVLHEVKQKHLTQVEAALRLKVTDRHVRRMLIRMGERGDGGIVHGLRGQPSNRKLAASLEQKILARVRHRYADFGPTLAAKHLAQDGLPVSRETLRKWMIREMLWRPRRKRVNAVHVWRERRACFGELVMQDSSPFRWLEDRGPACQLIALIDDATSRIWARFAKHDSTEENLRTLGGWLRRYGRPVAHWSRKCGWRELIASHHDRIIPVHHSLLLQREHHVQILSPAGQKCAARLQRRNLKPLIELRHVVLPQKLVRLLQRDNSMQPQLLRQPSLPGSKPAFRSSSCLRRIRRDHPYV
jgi:hypothetical protein